MLNFLFFVREHGVRMYLVDGGEVWADSGLLRIISQYFDKFCNEGDRVWVLSFSSSRVWVD